MVRLPLSRTPDLAVPRDRQAQKHDKTPSILPCVFVQSSRLIWRGAGQGGTNERYWPTLSGKGFLSISDRSRHVQRNSVSSP